MKKNYFLVGVMIVGMTLAFGFHNASAEGLTAPETKITIEGKKPVKFQHKIHLGLGVACGECHHNGEHQALTKEDIAAMPNGAALKCATCHNDTFKVEKLQKRKNIFHTNCKDCHKKGIGDKKGPTKCTACHGKRKAVEGC